MSETDHHLKFKAMGCPCEIRLTAPSSSLGEKVLRSSQREALRFERKYSRYRKDSVISRINQAAGRSPVTIDPETHALLEYSGACYEESDGLFDITSGVLRRIWNPNTKSVPQQGEIKRCLDITGWDKVVLESDAVFLKLPDMELDFGGVVKEYAADAIAFQARQKGIHNGYINLGGDIKIIGPQRDGAPWSIGVSNPSRPEEPSAIILLDKGAVSTSGCYERFMMINGKRYSHLLNPKTGWPVEGLESVSVSTSKALIAGSLSSIALLKGETEGINFLQSCDVPFFAIDQSGIHHGSSAKLVKA